jgi:hypothetical protein
MESIRRVNSWEFTWDEDNQMYECRGAIYYDDEHDEMPEPELWKAALVLEKELNDEGFSAEAQHSEKGWVEVMLLW